jgi:SAM-dependent methyltransferase
VRHWSPSSYGDAFADVYDDWYGDVTTTSAAVATLARLAGGGSVLELGVGTGRLAIPLAELGIDVHGIDASEAMLERLRAKPGGDGVSLVHGNMAVDLPAGPFALVFCASNTLFNLPAADQDGCLAAVADRLAPGGRFAVEAFVPGEPSREGSSVDVREVTVDRVVLSVARYLADEQIAEGSFVELTEAGGVKLRPWVIRWSRPEQLDAMAAGAGLALEQRWSSWDGDPFTAESDQHVSVFLRSTAATPPGVG